MRSIKMKIAEINGLKVVQDGEVRGFCLKSICEVLRLDFDLMKAPSFRERYQLSGDVLIYPTDDLMLVSRKDFIKILVYETNRNSNRAAIAWLCALAEEGVNRAIK